MGNGQSRLLANQRAVWPPVWLYYPLLLLVLGCLGVVSSYPSILAIQIIISLLRSDYNSNPKRKEYFIFVLVAVAGSVSVFFNSHAHTSQLHHPPHPTSTFNFSHFTPAALTNFNTFPDPRHVSWFCRNLSPQAPLLLLNQTNLAHLIAPHRYRGSPIPPSHP